MKAIQTFIDRNSSSDVIANLHDALLFLLERGLIRPLVTPGAENAEELRIIAERLSVERESGLFGNETARLLHHFQTQSVFGSQGATPADADTAARLDDILAFLGALERRSWRVRGRVTHADGSPAANTRICLFDRDVSKVVKLGEATTNSDGDYAVDFSESQLGAPAATRSGPNVFIGVFDHCRQQIAQSQTICAPKGEEVHLNLALSPEWTYLPYDKDDQDYFGCDAVVRSEWSYVRERRRRAYLAPGDEIRVPPDLCGLALSGGGIRSASFCLGVMQALSYAGWMKKLDYLSMVSGGSYIGGCLAWLLHQEWTGERGEKIPYGLSRSDFPFGSYPMVGMSAEGRPETNPSSGSLQVAASAPSWDVYKGRILGYLRQHASYLMPGNGINAWSLLAVVLRNSIFSIFAYGGLLVAAMVLLGPLLFSVGIGQADWIGIAAREEPNHALAAVLLLGVGFLCWVSIYPVALFVIRLFNKSNTGYSWRFGFERWGGRVLWVGGALLFLGVLPNIHLWLQSLAENNLFASDGSRWASFVQLIKEHVAPVIGAISTFLGGLSTLVGYFRKTDKRISLPIALLVNVGAALLVFGLFLLCYSLAIYLRGGSDDWGLWFPNGFKSELSISLVAVLLVALRLANLNYLSLHRYYRDRLMETFTPDLPDALNVNGPWPGGRKSADGTKLADIAGDFCSERKDKSDSDSRRPLGPYPIINTNIVLISSQIPKFRGRGGDNFILTPLYCGSNATGWCSTRDENSPFSEMTLPTAIATSGAAIDPNTGCGGEGVTRTSLLSFLMGFFNVRLGYWAENPTPPEARRARIGRYKKRDAGTNSEGSEQSSSAKSPERASPGTWRRWLTAVRRWRPIAGSNAPNILYPGLTELWLRKYLDENSPMVQLSDGGHFENLGLYELIRRRLRLIIVCDGAAHPKFDFGDLGNAIEKVRADFGALIELHSQDLKVITPPPKDASNKQGYADRGYLRATITYNDRTKGTLIYLTTTFFKELSVDLHAYREAHEEFPNQSTADQFFDEKQFEAYRELGYQTAYEMMKDGDIVQCPDVQHTVQAPEIAEINYHRIPVL